SLFLVCLLGASEVAHCQTHTFELYGQEQGLGSSLIRALAQDNTGFLWIGTRTGLFRYDGSQFFRFGLETGLPEEHVHSIHVPHSGTIWVGTKRGIARVTGNRLVKVDFGAPGIVSAFAITSTDKGILYVAAPGGLYSSRTGDKFERMNTPGAKIHGVYAAP